ncbi:hypothetical protein DD235_07435 [Corticimicrobacter populi]|uniref:TadE-like domain-containing protein n=2 Tax=Corticimicrobacter populi TaxID=2175229 RepID=A0A2V1K3J1_9BURK|nr:hypothetical protein DD235_07435 [Corticimicrobacter populi]
MSAMPVRSRTCLKRLLGDRRGLAALEYALVAPLLMAVLIFSIEMIVMMMADASLETAANRVARLGKLGIQGDCQEAVQRVMRETLSNWVAGDAELRADVKRYTPGADNGFGDIDDENYQPVCDAGERGDMVIYRLGFDRAGLSGVLDWFGIRLFRFERVVLIQNEP